VGGGAPLLLQKIFEINCNFYTWKTSLTLTVNFIIQKHVYVKRPVTLNPPMFGIVSSEPSMGKKSLEALTSQILVPEARRWV
jgi:hypothetical protein